MTVHEILTSVRDAVASLAPCESMPVTIASSSSMPFLRAPRGNRDGEIAVAYDGATPIGQTPHGAVPVRASFSVLIIQRLPLTRDASVNDAETSLALVDAIERLICVHRLADDGATERHTVYEGTESAELASDPAQGVAFSVWRIRFSVARAVVQ